MFQSSRPELQGISPLTLEQVTKTIEAMYKREDFDLEMASTIDTVAQVDPEFRDWLQANLTDDPKDLVSRACKQYLGSIAHYSRPNVDMEVTQEDFDPAETSALQKEASPAAQQDDWANEYLEHGMPHMPDEQEQEPDIEDLKAQFFGLSQEPLQTNEPAIQENTQSDANHVEPLDHEEESQGLGLDFSDDEQLKQQTKQPLQKTLKALAGPSQASTLAPNAQPATTSSAVPSSQQSTSNSAKPTPTAQNQQPVSNGPPGATVQSTQSGAPQTNAGSTAPSSSPTTQNSPTPTATAQASSPQHYRLAEGWSYDHSVQRYQKNEMQIEFRSDIAFVSGDEVKQDDTALEQIALGLIDRGVEPIEIYQQADLSTKENHELQKKLSSILMQKGYTGEIILPTPPVMKISALNSKLEATFKGVSQFSTEQLAETVSNESCGRYRLEAFSSVKHSKAGSDFSVAIIDTVTNKRNYLKDDLKVKCTQHAEYIASNHAIEVLRLLGEQLGIDDSHIRTLGNTVNIDASEVKKHIESTDPVRAQVLTNIGRIEVSFDEPASIMLEWSRYSQGTPVPEFTTLEVSSLREHGIVSKGMSELEGLAFSSKLNRGVQQSAAPASTSPPANSGPNPPRI